VGDNLGFGRQTQTDHGSYDTGGLEGAMVGAGCCLRRRRNASLDLIS
jgi:hypothetical protein